MYAAQAKITLTAPESEGVLKVSHYTMATKYSKGDIVVITSRRQYHCFPIGTTCEVVGEQSGAYAGLYELLVVDGDITQTVHSIDFKPATPDRIPVSCSQGDSDYHEGQPTDNF